METIAGLLRTESAEDEILALYPYVSREDIRAVERWMAKRPAQTVPSSKCTAAERMGAVDENPAAGEEALRSQRPLERLELDVAAVRGTPVPLRPTFDGRQLHVKVESTEYPMTVEGTVEGLPFVLIEEGEAFRLAVSPEPEGDPRTVTFNRNGFLVIGWVGLTRVRGEDSSIREDHVRALIEGCVVVLLARKKRGRDLGATASSSGGGRQR